MIGTAQQAPSPPRDIGAEINHIVALFGQGRHDEVIALLAPILDLLPGHAPLWNLAGAAQAGTGRFDLAIPAYDRAIACDPSFADAHSNRGGALRSLGRIDEALASFQTAILCRPDFAGAYCNLGSALRDCGREDEALACLDHAIALNPRSAEAHYNRGNVLFDLQRADDAVRSYDAAIACHPGHALAHANRGNVLQDLGRLDEALASLDHALALAPDLAAGHVNRGVALSKARRLDEALASYRQAVRFDAANAEAAGDMLFLKAQMCDWSGDGPAVDVAALGIDTGPLQPFAMLALDDDAGRHLRRSANWARAKYPPRRTVPAAPARADGRIRIGYVSADFYNHATMLLIGSMFERHDRDRFEIHAFSYGPDQDDPVRRHVIGAVDGFHDVRARTDADAAAHARAIGIDVAVDLKGYTKDARPGMLAAGMAPLQIGYLGYPGSVGADFLDYIVADEVVIPPSHRQHHSEKLIALPNSYQVNGAQRPIADAVPDRATLGLPEDGFVFCCFNNSYKISAAEFDIWMRLLSRVERSVLWLLGDNRWAVANLRHEAERRGVAAERLVFADRMPTAQHLARHARADLFLDTFACNAHTTASDALWAGLPVLSKLGSGFAARVAGSLLHAVGMPELVVDGVEAYEALALGLATDPARLAALRTRLAANRATAPLFDVAGFTRDLERGFALAVERQRRGLPPDHIVVSGQGREHIVGR